MTLVDRRIAVTGATGYVGSRLALHLSAAGAQVTAIVRPQSILGELERLNCKAAIAFAETDAQYSNLREILLAARPDAVVHVAAARDGGDGESETRRLIESNILFPALLLAAMKGANVAGLVNTGTSWQNAGADRHRPMNLYAATKQAFEALIEHHAEAGIRAITLRLFDVYGANDNRGKIISLLGEAARTGVALDMSPGHQRVDFVHVSDVCRAYAIALEMVLDAHWEGHRIYGASSGAPITLRELVAALEEAQGAKCQVNWGTRPYRSREVMEPFAGYPPLPGWRPQVSLREGLRDV
jgi:nucleoside-diphosphate-sugar epimerase